MSGRVIKPGGSVIKFNERPLNPPFKPSISIKPDTLREAGLSNPAVP